MESDPFALDQQALEEKLKALQKHFQRWRQLRAAAEQSADGSGDQEGISADLLQDELQWLTGEIQRGVKSLAWEVKDLGETLAAMAHGAAAAATAAAPTSASDRGRARFLGNARSLLASIEAELAGSSPSGAADEEQPQQQPQQPQPLAASDAELLLATDSVELEAAAASPRGQHGGIRSRAWALVKRHRAPLACVGCLLFLAFVLWVFYEAVLHGGSRQECVCTTASSATATANATATATATATASTVSETAVTTTTTTAAAKPANTT